MTTSLTRAVASTADDPLRQLRSPDPRLTMDGEAGPDHGSSDLLDGLATIWRRKLLLLAVTMLVFTAAVAVIVRIPVHYVASVDVMVTDERGLALIGSGQEPQGTTEQTLGTQRQILTSRALIWGILDALPQAVAERYAAPAPPGTLDRLVERLTAGLGGEPDRRSAPAMPGLAELPGHGSLPLVPDLAVAERQHRAITERLSIEVLPDSNVIRISYEERDPEVAVLVANAIAAAYEDYAAERRRRSGETSLGWIQDQASALRARVRQGEQQIVEARLAAAEGSGQSSTDLARQIDEMGLQIAHARQDIARREGLLETIARGGADALASGLPGTALHSEVLDRMLSDEAALEIELSSVQESFGNSHPSYVSMRSNLTRIRNSIDREVARIGTGIETALAQSRAELRSLLKEMAALTRAKAALESTELKIEDLERQVATDRDALAFLYQVATQVSLNGRSEGVEVELLSPAVDVRGGARPNKTIILLAAVLLSGLAGLAVVFLVDLQRKVITRVGQLGLVGFGRYVGRVDGFHARSPARLVARLQARALPRGLRHALDQAHRILTRAELEHSPGAERALRVLVTSHQRGEGKSTLAVLMAQAAARSGQRALLMDLDLRASGLRPLWPNEERQGIGIADLANTPEMHGHTGVVETRLGFHYLGPGTGVTSPAGAIKKFLRSYGMRVIDDYDVVIMDSAPVGAVAETHHLFALADCVVFTARAGRTRVSALASAAEEIPRIGLEKVRFVLNGGRGHDTGLYRYSPAPVPALAFDPT